RVRLADGAVRWHAVELEGMTRRRETTVAHAPGRLNGLALAAIHGDRVAARGVRARRGRGDGEVPGERRAADREARLRRPARRHGDGLRVRLADGAVRWHAVELDRMTRRGEPAVAHAPGRLNGLALAAIHGDRVAARRVRAGGS